MYIWVYIELMTTSISVVDCNYDEFMEKYIYIYINNDHDGDDDKIQ
jgi:hypothetical protein